MRDSTLLFHRQTRSQLTNINLLRSAHNICSTCIRLIAIDRGNFYCAHILYFSKKSISAVRVGNKSTVNTKHFSALKPLWIIAQKKREELKNRNEHQQAISKHREREVLSILASFLQATRVLSCCASAHRKIFREKRKNVNIVISVAGEKRRDEIWQYLLDFLVQKKFICRQTTRESLLN